MLLKVLEILDSSPTFLYLPKKKIDWFKIYIENSKFMFKVLNEEHNSIYWHLCFFSRCSLSRYKNGLPV